jgi:hypothetical protein
MKRVTMPAKRKTSAKRSALGPIAIIAGAAAVAAGGYYILDNRGEADPAEATAVPSWTPVPSEAPPTPAMATPAPSSSIVEDLRALAQAAAANNAPGANALADAATRAAEFDAVTEAEPLAQLARTSSAALAAAIARDASERTTRVAKMAAWAEPGRPAPGASAQQRTMALNLHRAQAAVVTAAGNVRGATDPLQAIAAARTALAAYNRFTSVYARAYTMARATPAAPTRTAGAPALPVPTPTAAPLPISAAGLAARVSEFKEVHNSAKAIAGQVTAMGRAGKPRSADGEAAQAAYRLRQDNAARARQYVDHLGVLSRSLRGAKTDAAAQSIVAQARTVRGYLVTLQARSTAAMPPRR